MSKVDRRGFFRALTASALTCGSALAQTLTEERCVTDGTGQTCSISVGPIFDVHFRASQRGRQWGWAASIEAIAATHGIRWRQESIIVALGGLRALQSDSRQFLTSLNGTWVADDGVSFSLRTDFHDHFNASILDILHAQRLVLLSLHDFPFVVLGTEYRRRNGRAPEVLQVSVFDVVPPGGTSVFAPAELLPSALGGPLDFVAEVKISLGPGASTGDAGPFERAVHQLSQAGARRPVVGM